MWSDLQTFNKNNFDKFIFKLYNASLLKERAEDTEMPSAKRKALRRILTTLCTQASARNDTQPLPSLAGHIKFPFK